MTYPNLIAEMTRQNITLKDIANVVERSPDTVSNWLKGKGDFPVGKAFKVQEAFFPMCTMGYLFNDKPVILNSEKVLKENKKDASWRI